MAIHPLAGKPAPPDILIDVGQMEKAYWEKEPQPENPLQAVIFGTSGHRGSPLDGTFNEGHILAITQAICDYRAAQGITGPLFMGKDTHAASGPAQRTSLEVLAGNAVETFIQEADGVTPTPSISRAILAYNRSRASALADGIIITPSHNPPADGGFKYNPPNGGPAETDVTGWIQNRANDLLRSRNRGVKRMPYEAASKTSTAHETDFIVPYVKDLAGVIDLEAIRSAGVHMGVDPMGGASVGYWEPLKEHYGIDLTLVNPRVDPTFRFMTVDHDGKIRMDCSSPYAMVRLVSLKDRFDISFGADTDADRHGIVTRSAGLMNPNHYLAVSIFYLLAHRPRWSPGSAVGKTLVSSSLIDRVVRDAGRRLFEVPVGFKWFAAGLLDGSICFGGEESAGSSFLRMDGTVWTTDKDGIIPGLLAAEMTAKTGKDPAEIFRELAGRLGTPYYTRIDGAATPDQRNKLKALKPEVLSDPQLAGEPILARLTQAPGNGAGIGGMKVVAESGWFAARPSGTEDVYKLYAESFKSRSHLESIIEEAQKIINRVILG